MVMQAQKLEKIRHRFRKYPEWLLLKVTKLNQKTNETLSGILLDHSPNRDEMYKGLMEYRARHKNCRDVLSVEYSEPKPPKDIALIFYA